MNQILIADPLAKRSIQLNSKHVLVAILLIANLSLLTINVQAASTTATEAVEEPNTTLSDSEASIAANAENNNTLAAQLQPSESALSSANQKLLSQNAQLQRQVNDLQTQVNVLVYESRGQLFLYGAFTVIISLLVGVFISWLVFVRRDRW